MRTLNNANNCEARLVEEIARVVFGWRSAPGRFITGGRSWLPRWRFSPFERLDDAFEVLDRVSEHYALSGRKGGTGFTAKVRVGRRLGKVSGEGKARTITLAVVHALGLELPGGTKPLVRMRAGHSKEPSRSKLDGA
jgi:hypothetical protein